MECLVVMECIYNVDAQKSPAFLCYIANNLLGQQWLFEKVEESNKTDIQADNGSEELALAKKRRWKEIGLS